MLISYYSCQEQKSLVMYHTLQSLYVCVWLVNTLTSTAPIGSPIICMWSPADICEQWEMNLSFSSADVRGAGTHDKPLRTSAWEARSTWTTSVNHPWILKMNFTRGLTNFKNLKCKSLCNRPFPSSKKSHFQSEAKCEAIDVKMIFNYDANKTHFHDKGFALSLVLKVRFFGTWKRPWFLSGLWAPHITHCLVQSFPEFHTNLKGLG